MPNRPNPSSDEPAKSMFEKLMGMFGVKPPAEEPATEPKDSPAYMAECAANAKAAADVVARAQNCPCACCKLTIFVATVSVFMWTETLRAAVTGDTSRLAAVVAKVEELQAAS